MGLRPTGGTLLVMSHGRDSARYVPREGHNDFERLITTTKAPVDRAVGSPESLPVTGQSNEKPNQDTAPNGWGRYRLLRGAVGKSGFGRKGLPSHPLGGLALPGRKRQQSSNEKPPGKGSGNPWPQTPLRDQCGGREKG